MWINAFNWLVKVYSTTLVGVSTARHVTSHVSCDVIVNDVAKSMLPPLDLIGRLSVPSVSINPLLTQSKHVARVVTLSSWAAGHTRWDRKDHYSSLDPDHRSSWMRGWCEGNGSNRVSHWFNQCSFINCFSITEFTIKVVRGSEDQLWCHRSQTRYSTSVPNAWMMSAPEDGWTINRS